MQKPTVGRIVNFVMGDGETIRPAIVVRVWSDTCINLRAFLDGTNDSQAIKVQRDGYSLDVCAPDGWATSVVYQEPIEGVASQPSTWHWPART